MSASSSSSISSASPSDNSQLDGKFPPEILITIARCVGEPTCIPPTAWVDEANKAAGGTSEHPNDEQQTADIHESGATNINEITTPSTEQATPLTANGEDKSTTTIEVTGTKKQSDVTEIGQWVEREEAPHKDEKTNDGDDDAKSDYEYNPADEPKEVNPSETKAQDLVDLKHLRLVSRAMNVYATAAMRTRYFRQLSVVVSNPLDIDRLVGIAAHADFCSAVESVRLGAGGSVEKVSERVKQALHTLTALKVLTIYASQPSNVMVYAGALAKIRDLRLEFPTTLARDSILDSWIFTLPHLAYLSISHTKTKPTTLLRLLEKQKDTLKEVFLYDTTLSLDPEFEFVARPDALPVSKRNNAWIELLVQIHQKLNLVKLTVLHCFEVFPSEPEDVEESADEGEQDGGLERIYFWINDDTFPDDSYLEWLGGPVPRLSPGDCIQFGVDENWETYSRGCVLNFTEGHGQDDFDIRKITYHLRDTFFDESTLNAEQEQEN